MSAVMDAFRQLARYALEDGIPPAHLHAVVTDEKANAYPATLVSTAGRRPVRVEHAARQEGETVHA